MISLLGSLLGFGSSLVGPVLDAWNRSADQKHELAMLHAQAEVQSKIQDQRLEASIVEADMAGGVVWFSATCGDLSQHRRMADYQLGGRMFDHR